MAAANEFLCVIGRIFELGVLELHFSFENLAVDFDKPQGAVEIDVRSRPLQQAFVLEPFDVGKVAQSRQPENLQELPRRDIGEGRAGFRRARAGGDEIEAF